MKAYFWQRTFNVLFWFSIVYAIVYRLWLSAALPFTVPFFSPHDGRWFFLAAHSIYNGDWLGETYNHFTLIKLPVYPLFLSYIAKIGLHPKIAIDLLYVIASLIFLTALRTTIHNKLALFIGFVLMLLNPITFSEYWARPLRLNLFISLVLIYLSAIFAIIAYLSDDKHKYLPLSWPVLGSVSLALAWHTREEAIWFIAALFPIIILSLRCYWVKVKRLEILTFWLLVALSPYLLGELFSSINKEKYGFDGISDTRAPEFSRTINAIYSLNTKNDTPYIYLTFESRDKLKEISEATRSLIDPLIDPSHGGYTHFGKAIRGDYASWAIRDSMASIGQYKNPIETEKVYKVIADDIENYCRQATQNCRPTYFPGVLVKPISWKHFSTNVDESITNLVQFKPFKPSNRMTSRDRGDEVYQYFANRFFNFNTTWDIKLEDKIGMIEIEKKPNRKLDSIYKHYKNDFLILVLLSLLAAVIAVFKRQKTPIYLGLMLLISFAASYSVYLLISLFAVPNFVRLLAIVSVPVLIFVIYFMALVIQNAMSLLFKLGQRI